MNSLQFLNLSVNKFTLIAILLVFSILSVGCILVIDPVMEDELYVGKAKRSDDIIYVSTTKVAGKYNYGARKVWFMLPDKTVFRLRNLSWKDPKGWELTRRDPNGFEEKIPLVQYNISTKDLIKWPTEWNLVPSEKTIKN